MDIVENCLKDCMMISEKSIVWIISCISFEPGDIILYLGSNITIYYDVKRWDFTLLGHIDGATGENLREFLGEGNPSVKFSLPE